MRATITGATGLVGSNLALELLRAGHAVRCTRRPVSRVDHLAGHDIEWVDGDLDDPAALARAFAGAEVVFHCAAMVSIRRRPTAELVRANVDGTRNVLTAVRQAGVPRLVYCSTVAACAISRTGRPVTEDEPWNLAEFGLDDGYSTTKYQAERLVRETARDLDVVIVNPTYMLGPYDPRPSSGRLIVDVVRGRMPGLAPGFNNFVDVRDVCRGMIAAWRRGRRGERYILGHENLSYAEIVRRVATVAGVRPPRLHVPRPLALVLGAIGDLQERLLGGEPLINSATVRWGFCTGYLFSSEKAERELGYRPGPIDAAIADAIAWFRQRGMLPGGQP